MGADAARAAEPRRIDRPARMSTTKVWLEGWPLTAWAALIVAAVVIATVAASGVGEPGLRATIRSTARLSALLLLPAFVASSANARWRTPFTKWLLRNRRYLGLGFAVCQFTHGGFVLALAQLHERCFWKNLDPSTVVGGGIGYVVLLMMTVTSFDRTAAWLGRRRWSVLRGAAVGSARAAARGTPGPQASDGFLNERCDVGPTADAHHGRPARPTRRAP